MGLSDLCALRVGLWTSGGRNGRGLTYQSTQALGCTLPPPLASVARTKKDGVSFLEVSAGLPIFPAGRENDD